MTYIQELNAEDVMTHKSTQRHANMLFLFVDNFSIKGVKCLIVPLNQMTCLDKVNPKSNEDIFMPSIE